MMSICEKQGPKTGKSSISPFLFKQMVKFVFYQIQNSKFKLEANLESNIVK